MRKLNKNTVQPQSQTQPQHDFNYTLSQDELQLLADFEAGVYVNVPNLEERKRELQIIAQNTLTKNKNINIRLSERDLHRLKVKAAEEGLPYQTLAASILHKAVAATSK